GAEPLALSNLCAQKRGCLCPTRLRQKVKWTHITICNSYLFYRLRQDQRRRTSLPRGGSNGACNWTLQYWRWPRLGAARRTAREAASKEQCFACGNLGAANIAPASSRFCLSRGRLHRTLWACTCGTKSGSLRKSPAAPGVSNKERHQHRVMGLLSER